MKHNDLVFGVVGTVSTFGLSQINAILGCIAGLLTVFIMFIRARKEWKHRDDPPEKPDKKTS